MAAPLKRFLFGDNFDAGTWGGLLFTEAPMGKVDRDATYSLQGVDSFGRRKVQAGTSGGIIDVLATFSLQGVGIFGIQTTDIEGIIVSLFTADSTLIRADSTLVTVDSGIA